MKKITLLILTVLAALAFYFWYKSQPVKIENQKTQQTAQQSEIRTEPVNDSVSHLETASEDYDVSDISAEELKPWVGEYNFQCVEAQGEGEYWAKMNIIIEASGDSRVSVWAENFDNPKKEAIKKMFGHFIWGDQKDKIRFQFEVVEEGVVYQSEVEVLLSVKDGKYYLESDLIVPEHDQWPIEIKKIK